MFVTDFNVVQANPYGINTVGRTQTEGEIDYIKNGTLYRGASADSVLVPSEDYLATLVDIYTPGAIAFTAGFKQMWQLSADGTWIDMMTDEEDN